MLKTDLLDNLIHKYELSEDSSIDDVFSDAQKTDPRYRTLSKEDRINLQRAFSNFWYASDEVPSIENQQNKSDLEASESQQLSRPVNCRTTKMRSHNRRPHKVIDKEKYYTLIIHRK